MEFFVDIHTSPSPKITYSLRAERFLVTATYINVPDNDCIAVAVEKVVALGISVDDNGHPPLGERQASKHTLCSGDM